MNDMNLDGVQSEKRESILIVGAGAIGRGFLAPYFVERGFSIHFADTAPDILKNFQNRTHPVYESAIALDDGYVMQQVPFVKCHSMDHIGAVAQKMNYIFFCVGVRELEDAARIISKSVRESAELRAIYSVENDIGSIDVLKRIFPDIHNIYFGVPDVITSSAAPAELKQIDPLCVASEVGVL